MSDECEMFGTLILESLLARQARIDNRVVRLSSLGLGISLLIAAAVPLALSSVIFERQDALHGTRVAANHSDIGTGVKGERLVRLTAPMAPKVE